MEPVKKVWNRQESPDDALISSGLSLYLEEAVRMPTIGERIKRIKKIHKHNQVEFLNMIGVSQGTLSELEQDKYKPALAF